MCFDLDSLPPIPPISGASVAHEDLELVASDGTHLAAFAALPDEPSGVGIVVLPDVRGLYRFYEELALRFAERGHTAVAIDYFGRTAGVAKRSHDWDYMPLFQQTKPDELLADVTAAVEWLRGHGCRSIFTIGFCFGGRLSWTIAASGLGLAGAIGFYGRPGDVPVEQIAAPILALQAGADQNILAEHNAEFERRLTEAGVEHELVTYDGAPHSFFDRTQAEHAEASDDAWARVLAFVERYG
jgi:carboxymethylenebutenolidase